jgi:hypothetical protein
VLGRRDLHPRRSGDEPRLDELRLRSAGATAAHRQERQRRKAGKAGEEAPPRVRRSRCKSFQETSVVMTRKRVGERRAFRRAA